jgi:phosphoglycolate phosphatase-like HAD superfamily hydrolase
MAEDGFALAVASSAKEDELIPLLKIAGVHDLEAEAGRHTSGSHERPKPRAYRCLLRVFFGEFRGSSFACFVVVVKAAA